MNSDDNQIKIDDIQNENSEANNQTNSEIKKKKIDISPPERNNTEKALFSKENKLQNIKNENQKNQKED